MMQEEYLQRQSSVHRATNHAAVYDVLGVRKAWIYTSVKLSVGDRRGFTR